MFFMNHFWNRNEFLLCFFLQLLSTLIQILFLILCLIKYFVYGLTVAKIFNLSLYFVVNALLKKVLKGLVNVASYIFDLPD